MAFTGTLFGAAWVFRPAEGSKGLAEVDELLDETLTEMGAIEDASPGAHRVDSVEYSKEMERRMKLRD